MNKRAARRRALRIKRGLILGSALLLVILIVFLIIRYGPSHEKADLKKYFNLTSDNDVGVVWQGNVSETVAKNYDGRIYVEYEFLKSYINPIFYFDYNENVMMYTLPTDIVSVEVGSRDYYISKNKYTEEYTILKTDARTAYIALDFVQKYTNLDYQAFENPNRVLITSEWGNTTLADVRKNDDVRYLAGNKSPIVTKANKGDVVWVLGDEGSWKKVRTPDGYVGYIPGGSLNRIREESLSRAFDEPQYTGIRKDKTINMVWNQVTNKTANGSFLKNIASTKGVNVVGPTWFALSDDEGNIRSLADSENVNYAHQVGMEVWATVNDIDADGDANNVLPFTSKRQKLVNNIISEAIQYNIDGINIDLELIKKDSADGYIQFIREMSVKCHNNGIVLSVDNYPPRNFNLFYNRKQQAVFADYVIVMAYDEHNRTAEEAGSVSSIGYVRESVELTLMEVPPEKLIMGIPFYTRLWKETPNNAAEGEKNYDLSVETIGMRSTPKRLEANGATTEWLEDVGQYYAEFKHEGSTYKIWVEDERSIEEKLKVMKEKGLAGVASWKLGLESESIWDLIIKYVN
ncbi:MAG: SH3 domain-containing protein [Lachnospiraceae bacterium]|nr:SH3 domain-containing protein [Lachnospiraceae bacterium]